MNIFKSKLQLLHDKDESFFDSRGRASPPGVASSAEFLVNKKINSDQLFKKALTSNGKTTTELRGHMV